MRLRIGLALAVQAAVPINSDSANAAPRAPTTAPAAPPADLLEVQVDWPSFVARSDMEWAWNTTTSGEGLVPVDWWNSAFLGNGNLGLQVVAGLHQGNRLAPPLPPPPPPPSQRCCCCWNRESQPCNTTSQCDAGGEGCIAKGTPTKRYGRAGCACDGKSHGCPALPLPPPAPPVPPLAAQPALRFEVGRLDITDDRLPGSPHYTGYLKCDRPRLAIGYLYLRAKGKVQTGAMRLGLWNAQLEAAVTTDAGVLNVSIFTHATSDVNVIHVVPSGEEAGRGCKGIEWTPIQGDALSAWQTEAAHGRYHLNPKMNTTDLGSGLTLSEQQLLSGNGYASAVLRVSNADHSCTVFQSTMARLPGDASAVAAQAAVAAASGTFIPSSFSSFSPFLLTVLTHVSLISHSFFCSQFSHACPTAAGLTALRQSHQQWWHTYYRRSFVSLGDTRLETFYWAQMYLLLGKIFVI